MAHKIQRYGWIPDLPDHRDQLYSAPVVALKTLARKVDLTPQCPPVYDQGQLGSCTANAIGAAFEFELLKQKLKDFMPSRLFIYYNERAMEGTVASDSGAQIRDGIKTVAKQGVCPEAMWPYVISRFKSKPSKACYTEALKHTVTLYQRLVPTLNQLRGCLASGSPFVCGITVYDSFESPAVAKSGKVPMPAPGEATIGGHAVMGVGYDDSKQVFIVRNSWGTGWGMKGYFTIPYTYLTDSQLSDDFWTLRMVQ